jgi:hypothetical protein
MTSPLSADPHERLADAVRALAARATDQEVRAQLHALDALVRGLSRATVTPAQRAPLEAALDAAMERGDERDAIIAMRRLAALQRAGVPSVDWSAASRG